MKSLQCVFLLCMIQGIQAVPGCPAKTKTLVAEQAPHFLSSPNYPGQYGAFDERLFCSWLIKAADEYDDVVLQIHVINSSTEYSTGCVRDSVKIYDGPRNYFRSLKSWCGSTWPKTTLVSSGRSVLVVFSTDFKNNDYYGFRLAFWVAKKPVFIVNSQEWRAVNYVLLAISVVLLVGGPGWLAGLYIKREVVPGLQRRKIKED